MSFGADAFIAIFARNIVKQQAMGHLPGSVLRVGEGVEIDNRSANGSGNVNRTRIVRNQHRSHRNQGGKFAQCEATGE